MTRRKLMILAGLALCTLVRLPSAEARCVTARITLDKSSGVAGGAVKISGDRFATVCNDTGRPGLPVGLSSPAKRVKIFFMQGQEKIQLAVVDADEKLQFLQTVTIPLQAVPGAARLVTEGDFVGDGPTQLWIAAFTVTASDGAQPPAQK